MSLLEEYKKLTRNTNALEYYSEMGVGKGGRIFSFQNTNYRYLKSFLTNYETFKQGADGVDRSQWELNSSHGQENLKQHTVNMLKSRFFSKNERVYYSTRKGETLELIPADFTEEEKWIILFLLLIDAYFEDIPNYILVKTQETYEDFLVYNNSENEINNIILNFIKESKIKDMGELFNNSYVYFDTFHKPYGDFDILANYTNASVEEKHELYEYINREYKFYKDEISKSKSNNDNISSDAKNILLQYNPDCLTKKFKPSGVYNKNMLVDNAKILYMSNFINKNDFRDFADFIHKVVNEYSKFETLDIGKVFQFIFSVNKDIFEMCYLNIFNPDFLDDVTTNISISPEDEKNIIDKAQNQIIIEDIEEIKVVSSVLKKKALERANYKCELEDFCGCSSHYFTNKKTGKNYVELHHLIPREFSNDFEKSIEQIENYVSLCPRCHRFIHYAVDRERLMALNYLYNKRIGSLRLKGIDIEEQKLKSYYKID